MNNLFEYIKNKKYLDYIILFCIVIVSSILFSQHNIHILSDRGRELLFPLSIINGQALYKDVLTIYFPLAYYINAVLFKIFGASLNTIYISQTIYCLIFSFIYFKVCKMFFDRFTSILATISIITSCLFFQHLFGYILPYSYSMTYGLLMFLTALYFLLKAFKTQKNEYFYISSLSASFAICCKIEFFSLFILIPIAMLLYKSKDILFYIKNILSISLFPIITIGLLFINGVTFYDIVKSIDFAKHFASSKSMYKFLQHIGMYPTFSEEYLKLLLASILGIILYCILIFLTVKIYNKLKNKFVLIFPISIFILILWIYTNPYCYTFLLPITVIVLSLCSMKDLLNNPEKLIVILFGMASSVRIFFSMQMNLYGTYTFPFLILAFLILFQCFFQRYRKADVKKYIAFGLLIYIVLFTVLNFCCRNFASSPLKTNKGTIYLPKEQTEVIANILSYIEQKTTKEDTILVLPEGSILNYFSDRKCDMSLHMLDGLYYEALGTQKTIKLLDDINYDYIILVDGFYLGSYENQKLFYNVLSKYIFSKYKIEYSFADKSNTNRIIIMKKRD